MSGSVLGVEPLWDSLSLSHYTLSLSKNKAKQKTETEIYCLTVLEARNIKTQNQDEAGRVTSGSSEGESVPGLSAGLPVVARNPPCR